MDSTGYKDILRMAIQNEIEAYEFYLGASLKAESETLKSTFRELADEEMNHRRTLEGFLHNDSLKLHFKESQSDYKVSEGTQLPPLTGDMSFADGIALAMKKEEEAMEMYRKFADASDEPGQKNTFLQLSKMEQGHKVRLEEIYTNAAYLEVW
ncbi:MAG TPA: ferritin family protein [Bacteroidales bacterium]|nr:ferritin family protein [Bacteroidales bacterium]HNS47155.1 ferritin family protein [Bacteroidales bacterium]